MGGGFWLVARTVGAWRCLRVGQGLSFDTSENQGSEVKITNDSGFDDKS